MGLIQRVRGLNAPAASCALMCPLPILSAITLVPGGTGSSQTGFWMMVLEWTVGIAALVFMGAIMGASQIGIFMLIRHTEQRPRQWALAGIAAVALIPLFYFVATGDFTSSSTAAFGLAIMPLYIAAVALPVSGLIWYSGRKNSE